MSNEANKGGEGCGAYLGTVAGRDLYCGRDAFADGSLLLCVACRGGAPAVGTGEARYENAAAIIGRAQMRSKDLTLNEVLAAAAPAPETECARCGKPREPWQVYCGAACAAQAEGAAAMFTTQTGPTCPACGSLVLPTGECVAGCPAPGPEPRKFGEVCRHGSLRRSCEPCDLWDDLLEARRLVDAARAEAQRLTGALEAVKSFIARYDGGRLYFEGWAESDSEYVVGLVDAALAPLGELPAASPPVVQAAPGPTKLCGDCFEEMPCPCDSVKVPGGKLIRSTPIKRAPTPMLSAREVARAWACNHLGCPASYPGASDVHRPQCDRLTAAIEARDATWRAELESRTTPTKAGDHG